MFYDALFYIVRVQNKSVLHHLKCVINFPEPCNAKRFIETIQFVENLLNGDFNVFFFNGNLKGENNPHGFMSV